MSAIAATATTPKPRKFFKSRASAGAQEPQLVTQPQPQDAGGEHEDYQSAVVAQEAAPPPPAPKPKSKHSKKKTTAIQEYFVPPAAQPAVEPEPAEYIPQPSVSQDRIRETIPSKRYLARTRKVQVNYNEDENSQPARPVAPPIAAPALTVPISAVSPSMEHPPIVLRISKVCKKSPELHESFFVFPDSFPSCDIRKVITNFSFPRISLFFNNVQRICPSKSIRVINKRMRTSEECVD